jgi:serine protease Do
MKETNMQIRRMRRLLPLVLLPVAASILAFQESPATESGQSCNTLNETVNEAEAPAQCFDRSFESFAPAVKKVSPAVVRIVTAQNSSNPADLTSVVEDLLRSRVSGQLPRTRSDLVERGLGTGVIVTEDGYILTTSHLVAGAREVKATLQDGRDFNAKVIGFDAQSDIAVIKIDAHDLPMVPMADSRQVQVGDWVLAIGHPFGVGQTVTHGIVSATDRGGMGIEDYESFIQTDAPINPGNSGGALVDITGQLIGINTAILSTSGGNLGIGFAVPSELARRVMTDLMTYGFVVRGYLGVETQDLTPGLAKEFNLPGSTGVLVGGVVHNGPAEQAGFQAGDVITRFDGKDVRDARHLKLSVAEAKPGQTVPVELLRDGSVQALRVTIRHASNRDLLPRTDRTLHEQNPGALEGVFLGELNSELRQKLRIPREVQGALVFDLYAYSLAAQAGLRPGDVILSINRQEVGNAGEAMRLMQNARDRRALLRVWRNGGSHFLLVANGEQP